MWQKDQNNDGLKYEGWEKMRAILDKEMPVKKRRRYVPFFIIALISIMVLLPVYFVSVKKTDAVRNDIISSRTKKNVSSVHKSNGENTLPQPAEELHQTVTKQKALPDEKPQKRQQKQLYFDDSRPKTGNSHDEKKDSQLIAKPIAYNTSQWPSLNTAGERTEKTTPIVIAGIDRLNPDIAGYINTPDIFPLLIYSNHNKNMVWDWFNPYLGINFSNISNSEFNARFELYAGNRIKISNKYFFEMGISLNKADNIYNAVVVKVNFLNVKSNPGNSAEEKINHKDKNYHDLPYVHDNDARNMIKKTVLGIHLNQVFVFDKKVNMVFGSQMYFTKRINNLLDDTSNSIDEYMPGFQKLTVPEYTFAFSLAMYYNLEKGTSINFGYKHYFSNVHPGFSSYSENFNSKVLETKNVYLTNKSRISNLFFGLKYNFD